MSNYTIHKYIGIYYLSALEVAVVPVVARVRDPQVVDARRGVVVHSEQIGRLFRGFPKNSFADFSLIFFRRLYLSLFLFFPQFFPHSKVYLHLNML